MLSVEEQTSGALAHRLLDDGRVLAVYPMIFTFRLVVGPAGDMGYDDCWCFHDQRAALVQLASWDGTGEPVGWHRHPPSGRRRPDGDPEQEYVNP
jgi:hypothetical protein